MSKLHPQVIQIEAFGVQGRICLRVCEVLNKCVCLLVLGSGNSWPQIRNASVFGRQFVSAGLVWREMRGDGEKKEEELLRTSDCVFKYGLLAELSMIFKEFQYRI